MKDCLIWKRKYSNVLRNISKKVVLVLAFLLLSSMSFATFEQIELDKPDYVMNDKRTFFDAEIAFDRIGYAKVLRLSDSAKEKREKKVSWEVSTLKNSFKSPEVKKVGDNLDDILEVLREREDYDAIEIINRYDKYKGLDSFDRSSTKLISFIEGTKDYPEADYLSGKVYALEGEYEVAERLFLEAYAKSSLLDVAQQKLDILYSLAEISEVKKDYKKYEEYLVLIVNQDNAYKNKSFIRSLRRTIGTKKGNPVEKFFSMYRTSNYRILNAYFALSEYYHEKGEDGKALELAAIGVLTGFTKIYEVVSKRNPNFIYSGLPSLLSEVSKYTDIVDWGGENNVWKGFNDLAEHALENGYLLFAKNLFLALEECSPGDYWRREARVFCQKIEKLEGETAPTETETVKEN